jgi:hypothetical protein
MEVQNRKNERPIQDEDHLDIEDLDEDEEDRDSSSSHSHQEFDESKTNLPVFLAIHKQQS